MCRRVSKILASTWQLAATAVGTPYYLSPEICQNRKYNQKVWGCGVQIGRGRGWGAWVVPLKITGSPQDFQRTCFVTSGSYGVSVCAGSPAHKGRVRHHVCNCNKYKDCTYHHRHPYAPGIAHISVSGFQPGPPALVTLNLQLLGTTLLHSANRQLLCPFLPPHSLTCGLWAVSCTSSAP